MSNVNTAAAVSGFLGLISWASIVLGHPAVGAIISDPNTATAATAVIGGIAGLFNVFMPAVIKPK